MLIKYGDFQIGKTKDWAKDFCIMDMLSTVMHNEYFHYMRTTWSLGYIANVSFTNMNTLSNRKYFINMLMQSPELDPEGLYEKTIGLIRNQIKKKIESLTPTEFISIKLGLHSSFKIPDHNIMDRLNRLFDAIICKHDNTEPMFDIKDKLINSLMGDDAINIEESGITKDDIISKYNDMITDPTIITIGIKPQ
jgi:secreted Zn-dependent insulinase-like peptidase